MTWDSSRDTMEPPTEDLTVSYVTRTGARSTRYPLSGLGCACQHGAGGLGIDGPASRAGAGLAIAAGALGLVYLLGTSKLAMNRRRSRRRRR